MSPDITTELNRVAPDPSRPIDLHWVEARASRLRRTRVALTAIGVLAFIGLSVGGALAVMEGHPDQPLPPVDIGPGDVKDYQVATFALQVLTENGLHDPTVAPGDGPGPHDYRGIQRMSDDYWKVYFDGEDCAEGTSEEECNQKRDRNILDVVLEGSELRILEADEGFGPGAALLEGTSGSVPSGPQTVTYEPVLLESDPDYPNWTVLKASAYWNGPIPSSFEQSCRVRVESEVGDVLYEHSITARAPSVEGARDSVLTMNLREVVEAEGLGSSASIECGSEEDGDGDFVPAEEGDDTYLIEVVSIEYPYVEADEHLLDDEFYCDSHQGACEPDGGAAEAVYMPEWSGDTYPGDLDCLMTMYDEDGNEVGSALFGLSVLDPSVVEPGMDTVPVYVSSAPARASGVCEAGQYQPGPGYDFEFVQARHWETSYEDPDGPPAPRRTELEFRVTWLLDDPDTRYCHVIVELTDGSRREYDEFSTSASEESPYTLTVAIEDPSSVSDADIECRTYDKPPTPSGND